MPAIASCVVDARAEAGESPVWSVAEQCLWWVDIWGRRLHRFDPVRGEDRSFAMPDVVAFASPHVDGGLVVALRDRVVHFDSDRGTLVPLVQVPLADGSRLNDAVVDAKGRLWIGSMGIPAADDGALWRIDADRRIERVLGGLHSPNGLAIAPDGATFYLSDSHPSVRSVFAFDFDTARGTLACRRTFVDMHGWVGRPDGACVDSQGRYWIAAVEGAAVLCLDAMGRVVDRVDVPVEKPSKPAFGGALLQTLYITSLRRNLSTPLQRQPLAGGVFAASMACRGVASPPCRIGVH